MRANVWPAADVDFYSFTATAGDRVYAATMTAFSAANSENSVVQLIASDGTTVTPRRTSPSPTACRPA